MHSMTINTTQDNQTLLQKERLKWKPEIPFELLNLDTLVSDLHSVPPCDERIAAQFPHTSTQPILTFQMSPQKSFPPQKGGILFSGGQAPGGHNVIAGFLDGLLKMNPESKLIGFLDGPKGLLEGRSIEITKEAIAPFRNQGGFDFLGSGRESITSADQFEKIKKIVEIEGLNSLVIVGGDDSNTIAVYLAEYFAKERVDCAVIGIPKTIDGDLRHDNLEISFGFDTACKTYAEMISNISRDILSSKKYYAFIRLMGREASHITLQCAWMTHPNLTLISEEIAEKKVTIKELVGNLCDLVQERAKLGKNYGVILLPEGLAEAIPHFSAEDFQQFDLHGNLKVSQIETERLLIDLVQAELKKRDPQLKFAPLPFFLGYEGRSAFPSNFDSNYTYSLGLTAAAAAGIQANGYLCTLQGLKKRPEEWTVLLYPLTRMLGFEMRKGIERAVIKKTLVDLTGSLFKDYSAKAKQFRIEDDYRYVGPIQFFGPKDLTDSVVEI